jgi:iron-regulated transporter 1
MESEALLPSEDDIVQPAEIATNEGSEEDLVDKETESQPTKPVVRRSNIYYLCLSHLLTSWGDRMWMYALGFFLVEIGCQSLLLPAISGLGIAFSVVMFGSMVGDWVDNNPRLRVVKISLAIVNGLVLMSSGILLVMFLPQMSGQSNSHKVGKQFQGWTYYVSIGGLVVLAAVANLGSTANTIALERDWIVVITHKDENELAGANAKLRRIDLACKVLSPVPVSLIMAESLWAAAAFIGGWSIIAFFIEMILLTKIYNRVPELATKEPSNSDTDSETNSERDFPGVTKEQDREDDELKEKGKGHNNDKHKTHNCCSSIILKLMAPYRDLVNGWKIYRKQKAFRAGLSLAALYLTVLGFNSVTNGYLYTQGLTVWQVSIAQAVAASLGITGTLIYPKLRRAVGLVRAGLIAITWEWITLLLPAASVFAPGNPTSGVVHHETCQSTSNDNNFTTPQTNSTIPPTPHYASPISIAMILLLSGTLASRIGLWAFDCASTQIFQETVPTNERGIVGGVQNVLNYNMDMLHFVLVIVMPYPRQFGYLVLVSVAMVALGLLLYVSFSCSVGSSNWIVKPPKQKKTDRTDIDASDSESLLTQDASSVQS